MKPAHHTLRRLAGFLALLTGTAAMATAEPVDAAEMTSQGRSELAFQGSYLMIDPDGARSSDIITGQVDYSYFFIDRLALRPQYQLARFSQGPLTLTSHYLGLGLDYHIPRDNFAFYFGGAPNVLFYSNGDSESEVLVEVRGGIKHYLSERIALNTQISYSFGSDFNLMRASLGLAFLFGGG